MQQISTFIEKYLSTIHIPKTLMWTDIAEIFIISFVVYLFAAIPVMQSAYILLPIGIVLTVGTLFVIKALTKKPSANNQ